ncbi:MAG: tetratricopeptide repeat protein [Polyangiaceae bacterium]
MTSRSVSSARSPSTRTLGQRIRTGVALPLIASLVLTSVPVFAQTADEVAGARSLAEQGFKAYKAEKWQEALDRFERAESLVHAPPHLLYAARASAKLGGYVKARELYNKILRETLAGGAPPAFKQAQKDAAAELPEVEKKIAYLTITISGPKPGEADVKLDGAEVPKALVGVERPVDPGARKVSVSAPGFIAQEKEVTLAEAAHESISIELVVDPNAVVAPPGGGDEGGGAGSGSGGGEGGGTGASLSTQDAGGSSGLRLGAYIGFGVGVVGLALGTVFLLKAGSSQDDSDKLYDEGLCKFATGSDPDKCNESNTLNEDAASQRTLSGISFGVGGAALVAGVVMFILSSSDSKSARNEPHVTPWVGLNSMGVSGSF